MAVKLENRNWKLGSSDHVPIKDFTDLQAWGLARELRKNIYDLTRGFPADEKHILTAQIRRAALSVTANIAEGLLVTGPLWDAGKKALNRNEFVEAMEKYFHHHLSDLRASPWTHDIRENASRKIWWLAQTS